MASNGLASEAQQLALVCRENVRLKKLLQRPNNNNAICTACEDAKAIQSQTNQKLKDEQAKTKHLAKTLADAQQAQSSAQHDQTTIKNLRDQIEQLTQELGQAKTDLDAANDQLEQTHLESEDKVRHLLAEARQSYTEKLQAHTNKESEITAQLTTTRQEANRLRESLAAADKRVDEMDREMEALQTQLAKCRKDVARLQVSEESWRRNASTATKRIEAMEGEMQKERAQAQRRNAFAAENESDLADAQAAAASAREALIKSRLEADRLRKALSRAEAKESKRGREEQRSADAAAEARDEENAQERGRLLNEIKKVSSELQRVQRELGVEREGRVAKSRDIERARETAAKMEVELRHKVNTLEEETSRLRLELRDALLAARSPAPAPASKFSEYVQRRRDLTAVTNEVNQRSLLDAMPRPARATPPATFPVTTRRHNPVPGGVAASAARLCRDTGARLVRANH